MPFFMNGAINTKNCVIWSSENPHVFYKKPLHSEKVIVWMGISKHFYVRPFFFHDTVNGERYLAMLQDHLLPELRRNRKVRSTIFMQDGAPAHISNGVKQFLQNQFGDDRVISRHFRHFWPPRSPEINPCDYWPWKHLQAMVFLRSPPQTREELVRRIKDALATIPLEMTAAAIGNLIPRLEALVREKGNHFQHLL